ncbi:MAG TPA: peptidoglycan editing factor PgeF [Ignavibacteriales bacterium]|nr:peptidoglycan editing factor PgeF [Ignavibacteriales bacterium]
MVIIKPAIYNRFPEIVFGMNAKVHGQSEPPYYFNTSHSVGDNDETVNNNRRELYGNIGLSEKSMALQKQIHSDIITYLDKPGMYGESDALITDKPGIGLAISTADCAPVFLYDSKQKVIAAVHSGWRGTQQKITAKALNKLISEFSGSPENIYVYIGPSISGKNYEVGEEVAARFDPKYSVPSNGKFLLDVKSANFDMLITNGIPRKNIQVSALCSYELKGLLHSYRRDGLKSGRSFGIIALRRQS